MSVSVRDAALAAYEAGLCAWPPKEDGSKSPLAELVARPELIRLFGEERAQEILGNEPAAYTWVHRQQARPDRGQLDALYHNGRSGLGVVCGAVSGNLEVIEFDDAETYDQYKALATAVGLGDLVERLEAGYLERTPGGGVHWPYFCAEISGNTKLARRPMRPEEMRDPNDKIKVLIETRGQGGYIVVAPSNGHVHPTGRPYLLLRGALGTIATITPAERRDLWALARTFDEMPFERVQEPTATGQAGNRPGDDFNSRATWEEILEPHGWTPAYQRDSTTLWRRPGTDNRWSASTNYQGSGLFYCWSTSTEFEAERGYGKFSVYAILNHSGDFKAAAAALATLGYGDREIPTRATIPDDDAAVAPFPLEALPESFRALVKQAAASVVAPADFIAVPLLVGAGAAIGDALELELKADWHEGANLYGAAVGDPGSKKTPALSRAMRPLYRLQKRLARDYDEQMDRHKLELATWEGKKKSERGPRPEPAEFRHVITTDATTEALAPMLLASKGLLLLKDELTGWVRGMDQYRSGGKGADRQHYLSMWARVLIKVDRKSNPKPIVVPHPCLSVFGGIQPELLPDLADAAQREDGFLDRLLWSYPDTLPDRWTKDGIDLETIQAVDTVFERLYKLQGGTDEDGEPVARAIRLSPEADVLWSTWYTEHAAEMATEHFPRRLRGPWAKMPSQFARLALILHALASDPVADEVTEETLAAAADLVDYFKHHARRVYRQLGRGRRDLVTAILSALKARRPLKQSDFLHDVFKRNVPAERIRAALEGLEEAGLVVREERREQGRPPVTVWHLA